MQLTFLTILLHNFNMVGFSVPGFAVVLFELLLADLAVLVYLRESAISAHGKVFSVKFEQRKNEAENYFFDSPRHADHENFHYVFAHYPYPMENNKDYP